MKPKPTTTMRAADTSASDTSASVRAMQMALVQLCFGTPKPLTAAFLDGLPCGAQDDAYRFAVARHIATWLGRPQRCRARACRRARRCQQPHCWRDAPAPLAAEVELAKLSLERQVRALPGYTAQDDDGDSAQ